MLTDAKQGFGGLIALAVVCTLAAPSLGLAHTKDDEAACRPDVYRLCKAAIPSESRIVACLERNKRHLSTACFRVFDRDSNVKPTPAAQTEALPPRWGAGR